MRRKKARALLSNQLHRMNLMRNKNPTLHHAALASLAALLNSGAIAQDAALY